MPGAVVRVVGATGAASARRAGRSEGSGQAVDPPRDPPGGSVSGRPVHGSRVGWRGGGLREGALADDQYTVLGKGIKGARSRGPGLSLWPPRPPRQECSQPPAAPGRCPDQQLGVVLELAQPALNVAGRVEGGPVLDPGHAAQERGPHFGNQLLFRVLQSPKATIQPRSAPQPGRVAGRVGQLVKQSGIVQRGSLEALRSGMVTRSGPGW